jgi:hypothetical protein
MKVLVTQSNFLPWRGFFATLFSVDKVVFLENVQYTKRDWRNRNIIRNSLESEIGCWISVPIAGGGSRSQLISEVKIDELEKFTSKFLNKFHGVYKNANFFEDAHQLFKTFDESNHDTSLSALNIRLIKAIVFRLGIEVEIDTVSLSSGTLDPSQRILDIVLAQGADTYLTGPAAKDYLNESLFQEHNVDVSYANFSLLPKGERMMSNLGFEFSIIDTIARLGFDETRNLTCIKI